MNFNAVIDVPFGKVGVRTGTHAGRRVIEEIVYVPESMRSRAPDSRLAERAVRQIEAYIDDPRFIFTLPLAPTGTEFQHNVWRAIRAIPAGAVLTYGQIARQVRSAPRAVGQACGANYFPLAIPCHRVVSATGLGGFANHDVDGYYLAIKRWLLAHEGVRLS